MTTLLRTSGRRHGRPRLEYGRAALRPHAGVLACSPMDSARSRRAASRAVAAVSAALAALALGCGAPAEAGDHAADAPDPDASTPTANDAITSGDYAGIYSVPVAAELEAYAAYTLESVRVQRSGSELRLDYELPARLLGDRPRLSFRGGLAADGRYVLEGHDGVATCESVSGGLRCDEVLSGLETDRDALDRLLAELPASEARGRRSVAEQFSIDPIGVLDVELAR